MLERLTGNARAAAAVFLTDDARAARRLLGEKEVFRELETRATEEYFGRARADRAESIEASTLFLDIVRDLKRVNAHLAAAAYPVLSSLKVRQLARPLMRDFATYAGGTVSIAMPFGLDFIYVETLRTTDAAPHVPIL